MTKVRVLTKEEAAPWRLARQKIAELDAKLNEGGRPQASPRDAEPQDRPGVSQDED